MGLRKLYSRLISGRKLVGMTLLVTFLARKLPGSRFKLRAARCSSHVPTSLSSIAKTYPHGLGHRLEVRENAYWIRENQVWANNSFSKNPKSKSPTSWIEKTETPLKYKTDNRSWISPKKPILKSKKVWNIQSKTIGTTNHRLFITYNSLKKLVQNDQSKSV